LEQSHAFSLWSKPDQTLQDAAENSNVRMPTSHEMSFADQYLQLCFESVVESVFQTWDQTSTNRSLSFLGRHETHLLEFPARTFYRTAAGEQPWHSWHIAGHRWTAELGMKPVEWVEAWKLVLWLEYWWDML
jgi:hypothetical protein